MKAFPILFIELSAPEGSLGVGSTDLSAENGHSLGRHAVMT